MTNHKINLPVENCFKIFDQSFNRVRYFSCIADSLDVSLLPSEWTIKSKAMPSYSMKIPNENEKQRLVNGYKHFMQCYLVRDCIESFALCLDELFFLLLLDGKKAFTDQTLQELLSIEERKRLESFQAWGLRKKIEELERQFKLELPEVYRDVLFGLTGIRNCFAHSNGFVRETDGQPDGMQRKFSWITFSVMGVGTDSGKKYEIEQNKPLQEEMHICLEVSKNDKSFKVGDALSFLSTETYAIAFSLQLVVTEFLKKINESLRQS